MSAGLVCRKPVEAWEADVFPSLLRSTCTRALSPPARGQVAVGVRHGFMVALQEGSSSARRAGLSFTSGSLVELRLPPSLGQME